MALDPFQKELLDQLNQGVDALGLELSEAQINQLLEYILEFQRWNKTHNLSAIHDLKDSVVLHLLDSLAVLPYLDKLLATRLQPGQTFSLADLGAGGGLPGIPLAIC